MGLLGRLWASWGLLGLILGLLRPPGAPFGLPGLILALLTLLGSSWRLLGLIFGLLRPPGAHSWPPRASRGSLVASSGLLARPFHQTVENTCRKHLSKGLSRLQAIGTKHSAQWPVWGAHAPTGDPATEPIGLKRGPLAKRIVDVREQPVKTQRLNGV